MNREETVFDLESNGFLNKVTKVWVVSYMTPSMEKPVSITDYEEIRKFFSEDRVFIGHNVIAYDFKVLTKVLDIDRPHLDNIVDTLPLSRTLMPNLDKYGLESFGKRYGVDKPPVTDWSEQPLEVYVHRCEEDVKINMALWLDLRRKLGELYG